MNMDKEQLIEQIKDIKSVDDERIFMVYQPIYNVKTKEFDRAESLMRMKIGDELIYPDEFMPIIEKLGLIHNFSKIAVSKTCDDLIEMLEAGLKIQKVSINFSFEELKNEGFVQEITNIIASKNIDLSFFAFEFTETTNAENEIIKKNLVKLKDKNISLYLDDFGKGFSNLDRLLSYPFEIIKVDKYITLKASKEPKELDFIVKLTAGLDKAGYGLLFEGVETDEVEEFCVDRGKATFLQGYYYSKPKEKKDVKKYFVKRF